MKNLTISLTRSEMIAGWIYLVVQLLILPIILSVINALLGFPLDNLQANVVLFAVNLLSILLIFHKFLWQSFKQLLKKPGTVLGTAVIGLVVYWFANFVVGLVLFILFPYFSNVNDSNIADMAQDNFGLILLSTVLLVPIAEEALYRGLLFGSLYQKSKVLGYLISTVVFCFIHVFGYIGLYSWDMLAISFVTYIPAGLCLSWAYAKSDCFFTPVLMHTIINAMGVFALR